MAVDQSSTPAAERNGANVAAAEAPTRRRRNCKTCNVLNLGRRKEDAHPLIGEVIAICEGINDEGLMTLLAFTVATTSNERARRKGDSRQSLRNVAALCAAIDDDAALARIKLYALEIAAKRPLTPAQEPAKRTAQVFYLQERRAKMQRTNAAKH